MTKEAKARLVRDINGEYILHLPLKLSNDSKFPFKGITSEPIDVSYVIGKKELRIEKST